VTTAEATSDIPRAPARKATRSDRSKAERKLGMLLCAPAAIVMIAVTGYPILYAIWLSLHRSDLRFPDRTAWIGLDNYITVLSANLWWKDLFHTVVLTGLSVSLELVLGMLLALAMHRAIFGRGLIRTSALVPYGIVTVVAAFAWRLAFSKADGGFVPAVLHLQSDPLITTWSTSRRSSPRFGRPRRSWRCCCLPASRSCPTTCTRRPRSTAPPHGSGSGRSPCR
jgi:multiple sugar transport system permease protein